MTTGPSAPQPATTPAILEIPGAVREIATRISGPFDRDQKLVGALNAARARLLEATGRLPSGLSAEALIGICGPGGVDLALSGERPEVLRDPSPIAALERVARDIRSARFDYQDVAEQRCQLAFDVAEANAELQTALTGRGIPAERACADVHALADWVLQPGPGGAGS